MANKSFSLTAPAKINLSLHVTGRKPDGYHTVESLVVFADNHDVLTFESNDKAGIKLDITGPFADDLSVSTGDNLVHKAAKAFTTFTSQSVNVCITLQKNIPVAAGLGGGSADAAAVFRGLARITDYPLGKQKGVRSVMAGLGADVPVCYESRAVVMSGIGQVLEAIKLPDRMPAVLVNPGVHCSTEGVFQRRTGGFSSPMNFPAAGFENLDGLVDFLKSETTNDLTAAAMSLVPGVTASLQALRAQKGCMMARMSGSGSTCFGIYDNYTSAVAAADIISKNQPAWWTRPAYLNPASGIDVPGDGQGA